jgi:hypothetical protein
MNIQKLISQVKQAKKRRILNEFHQSPRSGVDVSDEKFQSALLLLQNMFKYFKANKCGIHISFYGEIFITLMELGHSFEISISKRPKSVVLQDLEEQLLTNTFIKLSHNNAKATLTLSVKTLRKRAEWKYYDIKEFNDDGQLLAETISKDIIQRVRYYSSNDEVFSTNHGTTKDKLAAIHLGGALLGKQSILFYLSASLADKNFIQSISITPYQIITSHPFYERETTHHFKEKEHEFFIKYLYGYINNN